MDDEDDLYDRLVTEINDLIAQVKEASERFRSYPSEVLSDVLYNKTEELQDKATLFSGCYLELAADEGVPYEEQDEDTRAYEGIIAAADATVEAGFRLAATFPDSEAHEFLHSQDRMWISAIAQARAQGVEPLNEKHFEIEKNAEQGIIAYWRTTGLSEDAAYSAAALEISQIRADAANQ